MFAPVSPLGTLERPVSQLIVSSVDTHALITPPLVLDAGLGEILTTAAKLDWLLDHGARVLRPETRRSSFLTIYKHAEVHFEPLGVVAALVSWNYRMLYARFYLPDMV